MRSVIKSHHHVAHLKFGEVSLKRHPGPWSAARLKMILVDCAKWPGHPCDAEFMIPTLKFHRLPVAPGDEINTDVYNDVKVVIKHGITAQQEFSLDPTAVAPINHPNQVCAAWLRSSHNEIKIFNVETETISPRSRNNVVKGSTGSR